MKNFRKIFPTFLFLFWFILLSLQILLANGDKNNNEGEYAEKEKPSLAKILSGTISTLRKSHKNSWDKVKSIIHELQFKFSPPNLDFKGGKKENVGGNEKESADKAGEQMKHAAKKSAEVSKKTVEGSAKSAADAVQKTAEKVKDGISPRDQDSHDEL